MKRIEASVLAGFLLTLIFTCLVGFSGTCETLREDVLRLHILANSNSEEDQALKLKVRDRLLEETPALFGSAASKEEAEAAAKANIKRLTEVAQEEIARNGYDYPVTISVGKQYFSTREYETFTLPAGTYDAIQVKIGAAEGKNWWCVMFPMLCVPASMDQPEDVFTEEQAEVVENQQKYEVRFKVVEVFEDLRKQVAALFGD